MMPFDASTLALVEDALSEGMKFHSALDALLQRSGVSGDLLADARKRAEARTAETGRFSKAPKRIVVQEVLLSIAALNAGGDGIIAAIITALVNGKFPDATPVASDAIADLKTKIKTDRQEQRQRRREEEEERQTSARAAEREKETKRAVGRAERDSLRDRFLGLIDETNAQRRGYLLETFLNDLFDFEGLDPRRSFKLKGEQIDGAFAWQTRTYLVEAKWVKEPVAGVDFGAFDYKIRGKTVDTRGLYISVNGYSAEAITGLNAKGDLKFVCIDGAHIMRALISDEGLSPILERIWRHANETGESYLSVARL
jgi:hypothetical protein